MTEMITSGNTVVESSTDTEETTTTSGREVTSSTCPNCTEGTLEHSETCYSDVNALNGSASGEALRLPGKKCSAGCGWFQLDRRAEHEHDNRASTAVAPGDGKIALPNNRIVSVSHTDAEVNGEHGTFIDRDSCPICGGDVRVYVSRIHPTEREEACQDIDGVVEYMAYAEECCSTTCEHQKP